MKRYLRYTLYGVAFLLAVAALHYVFGREGLQPVLMVVLLGAWTALVAWTCYHHGLQAGYRQTMSLPPIEGIFPGTRQDVADVLRQHGDAGQYDAGYDEDESQIADDHEDGFEKPHRYNNF